MEDILIQLPVGEILLAQRVCSRWRKLIENSLPLQQALFYKAIETPPNSFSNPHINPLFQKPHRWCHALLQNFFEPLRLDDL